MNLSRVYTLDFETTGIDAKTASPVEIGVVCKDFEYESFINPGIPIPPETSAVHQIVDEDVAAYPDWATIKGTFHNLLDDEEGLPILVAHNAQYEKDILGEFRPVLWICTYKAALRVWPDAPNHKNETLRYWLGLGTGRGRSGYNAAHSALHDARVTFLLLQALLEHATLEQLIEWTEVPAKLPRMPMGKHFGQTWDTVPAPYLTWVCAQKDMREDVKFCAEEELKRRRIANATSRSG